VVLVVVVVSRRASLSTERPATGVVLITGWFGAPFTVPERGHEPRHGHR
jgi:hypothetical protein